MNDILEGFCWHSSIGIDLAIDGSKNFVTRLPNTRRARSMFTASGKDYLIHKTTNALWKMSDDRSCIEPVFGTDILSEDDVREAMKEADDGS